MESYLRRCLDFFDEVRGLVPDLDLRDAESLLEHGEPAEGVSNVAWALASSGKEVMVVAGGIYSSSSRKIGASVSVPDSTWKVVVVLDHKTDGAAQVTSATRVIGVIMPNDDARISTSDSWQEYRVPVRRIEDATGFDFLADVSRSVQDVVETRVDSL